MTRSEHYVVISADGHAGAPINAYKDYLEKKWHKDFDEWAASFADPWADLEEDSDFKPGVASADSTFSWDSPKRQAALESQGIVGEVLFPNTAPPFFPGGVLTVGVPQTRAEYERRWAGLKAHNRWLVDFCAEVPGRRAGVAQVFLNDVDDAVAEVKWLKKAGLTGGILLPGDSPSALVPLYFPAYDALWEVCADLEVPVHRHANLPGHPDTPETGHAGPVIGLIETNFFAHRGLAHLIFAGVFERYPKLKFVITESGAAWAPGYLAKLDGFCELASVEGSVTDFFARASLAGLSRRPSEYFQTNVWLGASFVTGTEVDRRNKIGVDRIMWGADLPHQEGTYPFSREALRAAFAGVPPEEVRLMVGETAAQVYSFDLKALQPVADSIGPTVAEISEPLLVPPAFPEETTTPALDPGRDVATLMTTEELEGAVGELQDRQAILDCLMRYSRGVDRLDRDLLISVYHEDAIDDHGMFVGNREEFADWVVQMHSATHLAHQHCLFNHTCDLDGEVAHTETYYMFVGMNRTGEPLVMSGGRYLDRFEKRAGRWAIAARLCIRDWAPLPEQPDFDDPSTLTAIRAVLPPAVQEFMRTGPRVTRDRRDPSYDRPLTVESERLRRSRELRHA